MVLYTIEPYESVFGEECHADIKSIDVPEGIVEASAGEDGIMSVSRLISTDPRAYLNPKYVPGSRLEG